MQLAMILFIYNSSLNDTGYNIQVQPNDYVTGTGDLIIQETNYVAKYSDKTLMGLGLLWQHNILFWA